MHNATSAADSGQLTNSWAPTLPPALAFDERLTALDVRIALVLAHHACSKPVCWPSNQTIARLAGCDVRSVRRNLGNLIEAGWIRRGHDPSTRGRGGEVFILTWVPGAREARAETATLGLRAPEEEEGTSGQGRTRQSGGGGLASPGGEDSPVPRSIFKEESKENQRNVTARSISSTHSGPEDDPPAEGREQATASPAEEPAQEPRGDAGPPPEPRTLYQAMERLAGDPGAVGSVANWIATDLGDFTSLPFYRKIARGVAEGEEPWRRLWDAYDAAHKSRMDRRVRKTGAIFQAVWKDWRPRKSDQDALLEALPGDKPKPKAEGPAVEYLQASPLARAMSRRREENVRRMEEDLPVLPMADLYTQHGHLPPDQWCGFRHRQDHAPFGRANPQIREGLEVGCECQRARRPEGLPTVPMTIVLSYLMKETPEQRAARLEWERQQRQEREEAEQLRIQQEREAARKLAEKLQLSKAKMRQIEEGHRRRLPTVPMKPVPVTEAQRRPLEAERQRQLAALAARVPRPEQGTPGPPV